MRVNTLYYALVIPPLFNTFFLRASNLKYLNILYNKVIEVFFADGRLYHQAALIHDPPPNTPASPFSYIHSPISHMSPLFSLPHSLTSPLASGEFTPTPDIKYSFVYPTSSTDIQTPPAAFRSIYSPSLFTSPRSNKSSTALNSPVFHSAKSRGVNSPGDISPPSSQESPKVKYHNSRHKSTPFSNVGSPIFSLKQPYSRIPGGDGSPSERRQSAISSSQPGDVYRSLSVAGLYKCHGCHNRDLSWKIILKTCKIRLLEPGNF